MQTEKKVFNLPDGATEVIIREGDAPKVLEEKPPRKTNLSGVIGAPYEYLLRRYNKDQFSIDRCHLIINRQEVSIMLILNENDEYNVGVVSGKLTQHPKFMEFGINTSKKWLANDFGQFCKMNRAFFADQSANRTLVATLKNYTAQIRVKYEKERQDNGSFKDNYSGLVSDNLPPTFQLKVPIFKGLPSFDLEIEFFSIIDGNDIYFSLCSPAANQLFEQIRDNVIDEQIALIRAITPEIVIIEI